jgi:ribosomal protein S18 acetylase RimI-like enzyme
MSIEAAPPLIRPARAEDENAATRLLLESGGAIYQRFAGSSETALCILRAGFRRPGNTASAEIVTVAEREGAVAGVIAAFPVLEGAVRARRYLRLSLARMPPWRWVRAWRLFTSLRPTPPPHALYVDAVATSSNHRRRGVASALLDAAAAEARELGCTHLALETEVENTAARSLYRAKGFEEAGRLPPVESGLGRGYVCLVKTL